MKLVFNIVELILAGLRLG